MTKKATQTNISIVIPTLNRSEVLVATIDFLASLDTNADEIIIVDQTMSHPAEIERKLTDLNLDGAIKWLRLSQPSVVQAMNRGLAEASSDYVLFLDDDIRPFSDLVDQHLNFIRNNGSLLTAGRVVESWDDPNGTLEPTAIHSFNSVHNSVVDCFMGGNFIVARELAIKVGGFDENFKGTAHDFEREFADRILMSGNIINYCGTAGVYHLKIAAGGIREFGHFLKTFKPYHALGAYYYILTSKRVEKKTFRILRRLIQRVTTRTHLSQPWWIPVTFMSDLMAIAWAVALWVSGPNLPFNRRT